MACTYLLHQNGNAEEQHLLYPAYKVLQNPQVLILCTPGSVHPLELEEVKLGNQLYHFVLTPLDEVTSRRLVDPNPLARAERCVWVLAHRYIT